MIVGLSGDPSYGEAIIPISGLNQATHNLVFLFIWPIIGGFILALFFPIIFILLFRKVKQFIFGKFEDGYLNIEEDQIDFKIHLKRAIFTILLSIGLAATIMRLIDPKLFISEMQYEYLQDEGTPVRYSTDGFLGFLLILLPIVIGLWSIGWTMEDLGLLHYRLPEDDKIALFEIKPMHLKYTQILKGYAGISALIYYIEIVGFYVTHPDNTEFAGIIFMFMLIRYGLLLYFPRISYIRNCG